ncbi:MAG: HigA family addiction module antidote protein [Trueperaceae bacterium]|nr:HigA family addiction module antidote protein [Trueperaceae bacterium]
MTSTAARRDIAPVHPGEILKEEFLEDYGLSQYELAKRLGVPAPRINAIVLGKRGISADTALLLARFFGNSPEFWLNLQDHYDLQLAEGRLAGKLEQVVGLTAEERAR